MAEKPASVEVYMGEGSFQVMFTLIYADGYRTAYWLPFWKALWHVIKLMAQGTEIKDKIP